MENIGAFNYHDKIDRNKLALYIKNLVGTDCIVGLHSIGFTQKDKKETASKISKEGLKYSDHLSLYSTIRFFGPLVDNNDSLNHYIYDQADNMELIIIVSVPKKFIHSSGQEIIGGVFPEMTTGQAKKQLDGLTDFMNKSDETFCPLPPELILGCYTFDKRNEKKVRKSKSTTMTRYNPYTNQYDYYISPEYYYEFDLGSCDLYLNPSYYGNLSDEEKDCFIEKHFAKDLTPIKQEEQPKKLVFKVINRTDNN